MNEKDGENLKEIKEFLDINGIDYSTELSNFCLWYNNPNGRRMYEIEYISSKEYPVSYPKYNIEGVDKDYFFNLSYDAEQNNSFKLWIKDFEWNDSNKKEILKSYILHEAGKTPNKFYARDCVVSEVSSKEARMFEETNCFYGKRGASLNLGLRLKKNKNDLSVGTLLMLYTFGKNFFGKKDDIIEVIRVGTIKFSYVMGGSSKLLKYFIKHYKEIKIGKNIIKVKYLKFYSDYDHNLGRSMDKLSFEFKGYSKGGFINYWIEEDRVKQRSPMNHKWVMEQMRQGKVISIPNAGVKTFIINLPEVEDVERQDNVDVFFK
uniref:Uncharacterized protein n=1 Tax=viral metagenome TaxID=1070528 RepID=A0A6M3JJ36_9ZZZZ